MFILACDKGMSINNIKKFARLDVCPQCNYCMFVCKENYDALSDEERNTGRYILQHSFSDGADARLLNFSSILGHRHYNECFDYIDFLNRKS